MHCPFCNRPVKLNEIVRSADHILGCRYCYASGNAAPWDNNSATSPRRHATMTMTVNGRGI